MGQRIIYVTDLHGANDRLELLLELTSPDLYIISGDLLYNPYYSIDDMQAFTGAQQTVRSWYPAAGRNVALPLKLRAELSRLPAERRQTVETYLELADKAHRSMLRKFRTLERITQLKPRTPMYFLPGNYDLDLSETALAPLNLHRRTVRTPLGTVGGYGGAPVFTPGIPQHLAVPFHEDRMGPGAKSDPFQLLRSLDPDIATTHVPPLGILDGSPSRSYGSWGIRDYLDAGPKAKLLLCGHVHDAWGVKLAGQTWVVNSGAFGAQVAPSGYRRGGYFAEIDFDPYDGVNWVVLKRLERTKVWHLVEYRRGRDGRLVSTEVEPKRLRERRTDTPVRSAREAAGDPNEFDLEELQMYNQIKLFMRRFETVESEQRIDDLREMVAQARAAGTEIAFDVLGSLNMGQSLATSDIDAILYIADDPAKHRYQPSFWPDLVSKVTRGRYKLDITDVIDLWEVREAIEARDADNEALQRFVVYRTIARPVNVRLLRRYDDLLIEDGELKRRIQEKLRDDLRVLAGTFSQTKSFEKYMTRLREAGVRIPSRIATRIHRYLHTMLGEDG